MELNLVMAIVNRDRGKILEGIIHTLRLPMSLTMMAQGTATMEVLSIHGLLPTEKALVCTVADGEQTARLL